MSTPILLCGDARTLVPDATGLDCMITDPPYSDHVHASAVSQSKKRGARKREFGFEALTQEDRLAIASWAKQVSRWSVVYSDIESTHLLRSSCSGLATYIRTVPWIRWSMPQLSGDRPPQGREDLLIFHAPMGEGPDPVSDLVLYYGQQKGRKAWNGPGNLTHLAHKCLRGEGKHRAEKPLDQALDLVSWFSDPGETVFDPFMGAGTFGLACRILGRGYVGVEKDPEWHAKATARIMSDTLSDRDHERHGRWLESKQK